VLLTLLLTGLSLTCQIAHIYSLAYPIQLLFSAVSLKVPLSVQRSSLICLYRRNWWSVSYSQILPSLFCWRHSDISWRPTVVGWSCSITNTGLSERCCWLVWCAKTTTESWRDECHVVRLVYNASTTIAFYHQRRRWSAVDKIRNLGVDFDSEMTMRAHIAKTTQTCFFISDVYARSVGCWGVMLSAHLSQRQITVTLYSQVYHNLPLHLYRKSLMLLLVSSVDFVHETMSPMHWSGIRTPLATNCRTYRVQVLSVGVQCAKRSCAVLHHRHATTRHHSRPPSHIALGRQ